MGHIRLVAIRPILNKNNTHTVGYTVKDEQGEYRNFSSIELKTLIKSGAIIRGLHLSKDGRLLRDKPAIAKPRAHSNLAIYTGYELIDRCKTQSGMFSSRNFVPKIIEFCNNKSITNRIMLIHGIRRTGKTTSLHHAILDLANGGAANIYLIDINSSEVAFNELYNSLLEISKSIDSGIVFIDEITNVIDIVNNFNKLSDQLYNLKIVVSGTDSYVFPISYKTTLFGRAIAIHSSLLSYSEYTRLMSNATLASYKLDGSLYGQEFVGNSRAISAVNSAVIGNIISTLTRNKSFFDNDKHIDYCWLTDLSRQELEILIYSILVSATEHKSNSNLNTIIKAIGKAKAEFIEDATGIPKETIPSKLDGVNNFTLNNLIKALSEIDIIRQMNNLASILCSDEQLNSGYRIITDKSICVLQPGLLNSLLQNSRLSIDKISGIEMENLVSIALYCCSSSNNISISNIGYLKYTVNNAEHEIDVVIKMLDNNNNVAYTLIEVKNSTKQKLEYIKHLVTKQLPERLLDAEDRVVKLVIYNGTTDISKDIKYINIEDFIKNPWNYII